MRNWKSTAFAILLGAAPLCQADTPAPAAQPAHKTPAGIKVQRDIPYIPDGDTAQRLDLYTPDTPADKPQPLLIWIHGGGWSGGSKNGCRFQGEVRRGYIVASVEYRFSQKAAFPAQIQDCQAALRFLKANAAKYNIDPSHVGIGGDSAGGHLVALLGTAGGKSAFPPIGGNEDQDTRVQAVVDFYGPTDFCDVIEQAQADTAAKNIFNWNHGDPYSSLIHAKLGEDKEKCEAVSPVHYASKDNPPFLILHGDHDTLVPFAQSQELADLLKKEAVQVTLQRFPGAGHGGPAFGLPAVNQLINAFLDKHLKGIDANIEALPEDQVSPAAKPTK